MINRYNRQYSEFSNTWVLLGCFVIFYFLFRYIQLNSIITMKCGYYEDFWTTPIDRVNNLYIQFFIIFMLFGYWAFFEMYSANKLNYQDKHFCNIICSVIIIAIFLISFVFQKQKNYINHQRSLLKVEQLTYRLKKIPYVPYYTQWDKFKRLKQCQRSRFKVYLPDREWLEMRKEFIENGGHFEARDRLEKKPESQTWIR